MDMKKISAACATAAALAALCVPGAAFAADGTLTLNAGDGSTLAGHSFTVYKLANYNDVVKDGANVKSVSASSPDAAADAWVKAALNKNGVTYNTSEGRNAAEQLLRLQTDTDTLRKVAGTLQSTAAASRVTAVKTNQTSTSEPDPAGRLLSRRRRPGNPDSRVHHDRRQRQEFRGRTGS